jgi:gp16 family phage-associated protein
MTNNQIRARLIEQGLSFRQFALANGYDPRTVTQTVMRWAGSETLPNGRIAFSIMRDLSRPARQHVCPSRLTVSRKPSRDN